MLFYKVVSALIGNGLISLSAITSSRKIGINSHVIIARLLSTFVLNAINMIR